MYPYQNRGIPKQFQKNIVSCAGEKEAHIISTEKKPEPVLRPETIVLEETGTSANAKRPQCTTSQSQIKKQPCRPSCQNSSGGNSAGLLLLFLFLRGGFF